MEVDTTAKMADPYKARELWTQIVRGAADRGKLEKIPTKIAKTAREREQARLQNYYLSRKSYGAFGENYDRIDWSQGA